MTGLGGGVFRRLLHQVDHNAPSVEFGVVRLWFALCGAACVVLGETDTAGRTACESCFPTPAKEQASG